jgi:TPR repeat protein
MSPWLRKVSELLNSGKREAAIALVRELAQSGSLAAKVRLARFGAEAGISRPESDEIVDQAEVEHGGDDADVHWVLYGAYEVGLDICEYDEKSKRALRHLERYAVLTNDAMATRAVAAIYSQGNIGTPPSPERAKLWFQRAAQAGDQSA